MPLVLELMSMINTMSMGVPFASCPLATVYGNCITQKRRTIRLFFKVEIAKLKEHDDYIAKLEGISKKAIASAGNAQAIADAGSELQKAVDDYKNQVKGWGETARKALLTAVKSAGIPIPM